MSFIRRLKGVLPIVLLMVQGLLCQEYLWPTQAGTRITTTFGDMRPRRYHAGIDISTNGGTGYEVYAIEDGYIERVQVSTEGYGKAIYQRLKDGRLAVYAHLQGFTPRLNAQVRTLQEQNNRYALDLRLHPTDFPVRKGDILAYTGDTGTISGAHLHFELRDTTNRPINPLVHGLAFDDELPPEIRKLALIPLSPRTVAHGSTLPTVLAVRRVQAGSYIMDDTLVVRGPFGLAISVQDRVQNLRYRHTPYGLSLEVDGTRLYGVQFDRYDFQEGKLSQLERDYYLYRRNQEDFHRLFVTPQTRSLSFVRDGSDGVLELSPGYHRFSIKVWDKNSNVSVLRGTLAHTPPTSIAARAEWSQDENGWVVTLTSSARLRRYHVFFFDIRGNLIDQFSHTLGDSVGKEVEFLVPHSAGRRSILQIVGIDQWGARLEPVHVSLIPEEDVTRQRQFTLIPEHLDRGVLFQLTTDYYLPFAPEILLRTDRGVNRYPTTMVSPVDFLSPTFNLAQVTGLQEIIVRVNLRPAYEVRLPVTARVVIPGQRWQLLSPDGLVRVEFSAETFYDSTFVWLRAVTKTGVPGNATLLTLPMEIGPSTRAFNGYMGIEMRFPANRILPDHGGIFYLDQRNGWKFMVPADLQSEAEFLETRAYRTLATDGEVFALIDDREPPEIRPISPDDRGTYRAQDLKKIQFRVEDSLAGIKDETALGLELDNRSLILEYNTYRHSASYILPSPLSAGEHRMVITATDQVGNSSRQTVTFTIR